MPQAGASNGSLALAEVRTRLRRQIGSALGALQTDGALSDEAIHRARKDLKRARASLRLLRDVVGKPAYRRENARLRDAAQPLGDARDAKVMLELAGDLQAREKKHQPRAALERMVQVLRADHRSVMRKLRSGSPRLIKGVHTLKATERRLAHWRIPTDRAPALEAGIARIYRRGRKALRTAASDRADDQLHEARKQAKYLGQVVSVASKQRAGSRLTKVVKRAALVASWLGDDHNLAVLQSKMARMPVNSGGAAEPMRTHIARRRAKLQQKALKQGRRLYKKTTKRFIGTVHRAFNGR